MPGATSFPSSAAIPNRQTVLTAAPERVAALVDDAFEIYSGRVDPVGIRADISAEEFSAVYRGEGRNAPRTPLEGIFPDSHRLALFAVTVGEVVCGEILRLFGDGDPALGYALDTTRSTPSPRPAPSLWPTRWLAITRTAYRSQVRSLPTCGYCRTVRVTAVGMSVVRGSSSKFFALSGSASRSTPASSCSL